MLIGSNPLSETLTCSGPLGRTGIYRFDDSELAEIEAAMRGVKARGLNVPDFGCEEFPLPTLRAKIAKIVS